MGREGVGDKIPQAAESEVFMMSDEHTDWEALCSVGRLAAEQIDEGRWIVGDTALLVEKHYGEDRLADYARECNLPKKRVAEYRTVCRRFQKSARAAFWETCPTLTYSHFRAAMRYEDEAEATEMLFKAADEAWTVDQFQHEIAKDLGEPSRKSIAIPLGNLPEAARRILDAYAPPQVAELLTLLSSAVSEHVS